MGQKWKQLTLCGEAESNLEVGSNKWDESWKVGGISQVLTPSRRKKAQDELNGM